MTIESEKIELTIETKEIELGKNKVKVKQYLPTQDKSDMLNKLIALCFDKKITDQPKIDALFNALIVLNYTDIDFTGGEEDSMLKLYDFMETNDYITKIVNAIPNIEYNALIGYYKSTVDDFDRYKVSSIAMFDSVLKYGPELMEKIGEISKEIDLDAIKLVADISSKMSLS